MKFDITQTKILLNNFSISKPIPIDIRFVISSWDKLDSELPQNLRYPGLIFWINDISKYKESLKNINTLDFENSDKLNLSNEDRNHLFMFETDLTKPIHFPSIFKRFNNHCMLFCDYLNGIDTATKRNDDYLKQNNFKYGQLIYFWDLEQYGYFVNHNVVNGFNIEFLEYDFKIPDVISTENRLKLTQWFETNFTNPYTLNGIRHKFNNNVSTDSRKILLKNGICFYVPGDVEYQIGLKTKFLKQTLQKENILTHNFEASLISCKIFVGTQSDIHKKPYENSIINNINLEYIDNNKIKLYSDIVLENCLIELVANS